MTSEDTFPQLGIVPFRELPGSNALADKTRQLALVPFREALETEWPDYAHFVQYVVTQGNDVVPFPRVNKPCLPEIRAAGGEVWITCFGVDIDSIGHQELTKESYEEMETYISEKLLDSSLLPRYAAYYSTRKGVRFIYVLSEPVLPEESEALQKGLIQEFKRVFLIADHTCFDWGRIYGLPRGMRDGTRLGDREFDVLEFQEGMTLDPKLIPKLVDERLVDLKNTPYAKPYDGDLPDDTIYAELCRRITENGAEGQSKWFTEAKRRLKGRKCFDCLFNGNAMAQNNARDVTLQIYVGEACALLSRQPSTTPEHLYALFLPAILRLDDDEEHNWRLRLWTAICKYWTREVFKNEIEEKERQETLKHNWETLIENMRKWNKHPALHGTEEEIQQYIHRHAILSANGKYFVLRPDGKYDTEPVDKSHLIARIRELGMDVVIPTWSVSRDGASDKSIQGMLNQYVSTGYEIDGVVDDRDGIVIGTKIIKQLFRRSDIVPEFSTDVDAWLRSFAGAEYERLCKWIGFALAWEEGPTCALSITGRAGSGKKLLVQGLIECVNTGKASDATEFSRFKHGILTSPFLVINEGLPDARYLPMSPADTFRSFVGGDPIRVEEKHQVPITVRNPLRVIFTTNNEDIIYGLAGARDLTEFDREAIADRIYHIDVNEDCSRWLFDMGGMDFTRGWVTGDGGQPSEHVVAAHFMHLYETRPKERGKRFLMHGANNERIIKAMTLRSGGAPAVFEVLTKQIESVGSPSWSAVVEDGKVFVTEAQIEEYDREARQHRKPINLHTIRNVLAAMRAIGTKPETGVKGTGPKRRLATWHQLNLRLILEEAIERGLPCTNLQKLVGYEVPKLSPPLTTKKEAVK